MRVSEILRQMADMVAQAETSELAVQEPVQEPAVQEPVVQEPVVQEPAQEPAQEPGIHITAMSGELDTPAETPCGGELDAETATMVSPQQQELELLKKSNGVDNNVSEFVGDEQAEDGYQDELAAMKQTAGIGEEQASKAAYEEQRQMEAQLNPRRNAAIAAQKARSERSE